MPLDSGGQEVDLTLLSQKEWGNRRVGRYAAYGFVVLFLVLFALKGGPLWLYAWASGRGFPIGDGDVNLLTTVVLLGLSAFCVLLLASSKPGPTSMTIGADALAFHYPSGRVIRWHWADPRLRFDLYDYHHLTGQSGGSALDRLRRPVFDYCLRSRSDAFVTALPRDGFEALLESARVRGLTIAPVKPQIHFAGGEDPRARVLRVGRPRAPRGRVIDRAGR